jgi:uncharacterized SAM-binding protein YcdF (DUF218 family)
LSAAPPQRKRAPQKRDAHRSGLKPRGRGHPNWKVRGVLAAVLAVIAIFGWAILARQFAPRSNTSLSRFDTIIVLGTPADRDGNPTPRGLARATEGAREYERGVAPHIIFSGGSTSHGFVEAQVLARAAEAQGVPESAVFVEPRARDTIQNVCYSERIMNEHGWHSAEVVSNGWHLERAALILGHTPLEWSVHAAPSFERETGTHEAFMTAQEIVKTVRYLVWTRQTEKCEP